MTSEADEKKHEQKRQIAQILKILLKEGEKGVLMKTVADRIGTSILDAQHAMNKLMEKQMVEEITSVSGTKYYLTEIGKAYCRSKAK
jgi:predicted transcriptional regulator